MKKISFLFTILIFIFISLIAQKIHIVKKGDTLWDIAGFYYNNPFLWRNIYNANLDKIEDPHWIYPGQEFIIPDIPEDATYTETITEEPTATSNETREGGELIIEKETENKQITYQKSNVEKTGAKIKAIREDLKKVERTKSMRISNSVQYAVAKKMAFQSGFIAMENPAIGKIDKLYKGSVSYTTHEKAYIKLDSPDTQDIIGKKLIIFKWDNSVKNSDGENLGKYVKILGTIKIEKIENDLAYGTIITTYDIIDKGDYVGFYKAPIIPLNSAYLKESNDIRAYLIDSAEPKRRINEFSIVLIDIGKENNINSGDVFTIIRKNKTGNYYAAGAVQVLVPYDGYSTAAVISIKDNTDIAPYEELKLSYRNKNAYILEQYRKINTLQTESNETEETIMEETPAMESEETTETEEPVIETAEETTEEPVIETEETINEENTEEPTITDTTQTEEEIINETEEGFTIEETEEDTTNNDTLVIEGEDEIIIIEE